MGEVNKFSLKFSEIKDYLPIALLVLYFFGYIYLKLYYLSFGINFEYYISLTDIVFFSVEKILLFSLSLGLFELFNSILFRVFFLDLIYFWYLKLNKKILEFEILRNIVKNKMKLRKHWEYAFYMFSALTLNLLDFFLFDKNDFETSFVLAFNTAFFFKMVFLLHLSTSKGRRFGINGFAIFLIVLFAVSMVDYAIRDSKSLKAGEITKFAGFEVGMEQIETGNSDFSLIGETSNYIFIYDHKNKISLIFNKSTITVIKREDINSR